MTNRLKADFLTRDWKQNAVPSKSFTSWKTLMSALEFVVIINIFLEWRPNENSFRYIALNTCFPRKFSKYRKIRNDSILTCSNLSIKNGVVMCLMC